MDYEQDKPSAKIIPIKPYNRRPDFYTIDDLVNSPLSIYGIFWTIKNLLMHMSSEAVHGEDYQEKLKEYYFYSLEEKDEYDIELIRLIHRLMKNTIIEMSTYPDSSIDAMIAETMLRFNRD
jgi:hypothetical protein